MSRNHNPNRIILIRVREDGVVFYKEFGYTVRNCSHRNLYEIKVTTTRGGRKSFYGKNPNEAVGKAKLYLKEMYGYGYNSPSYTLAEWANQFLDIYGPKLSPRTKSSYKSYLEHYILPRFGHYQLSSIEKKDAQEFADSLRQEINKSTCYRNCNHPPHLDSKTIHNIFSFFIRLLNTAMQRDLVSCVVAQTTMIDRPIRKEAKHIPQNLLEHFFRAIAGSRFESFYHYLLFTGARLSEGFGLTIDEIENKKINVIHQLQCVDVADIGQDDIVVSIETIKRKGTVHEIAFVLTPTKNNRTTEIHMSQILKYLVDKLSAFSDNVSQHFPNPYGFIFVYENGSFYRKSTVEKDFKEHLRKYSAQTGVNFKGIHLHSLRHSFVSLLFSLHVDEQAVSNEVGHSNVSVTNQMYRHLSEAVEKDYLEKKNELDNMMYEMIVSVHNNM